MNFHPFGLTDDQIAANFERMRTSEPPEVIEANRSIGLWLYALQLEGIIAALEFKLDRQSLR